MTKKSALTFIFLLVFVMGLSKECQMSMVPPRRQNLLSKSSALDLPKTRGSLVRSRRYLGNALSLLWPQVVGPVEQGIIHEHDYSEVPKTLLEYRLDLIRKKAQEEEENRLIVRNYMKKLTEAQDEFYGFSNGNLLADDYT